MCSSDLAFCIYSEHYRGTPRQPGLILGLLPGGACRGLAHRLPVRSYAEVRRYLVHREIDHDGVYEETVRPILLDDGRTVQALVYLADRAHRQFAGKLPPARAASLVRRGRGATGSNVDYVRNTVAHLREMGLRDRGADERRERKHRRRQRCCNLSCIRHAQADALEFIPTRITKPPYVPHSDGLLQPHSCGELGIEPALLRGACR